MASLGTPQWIVLHCSATKPSQDIGAAEIDRMHRRNGWLGIGYHGVIRRNGAFEMGRPWSRTGAHAKEGGFNRKSLGFCLVGGVSQNPQRHVPGNPWNGADAEDNFTEAQFQAARLLIEDTWRKYRTHIPVIGHRDIPRVTKACPSFSVAEKMEEWFPKEYSKLYPRGFPSRWEG